MSFRWCLVVVSISLMCAAVRAAEPKPKSNERLAADLVNNTVTVRISPPKRSVVASDAKDNTTTQQKPSSQKRSQQESSQRKSSQQESSQQPSADSDSPKDPRTARWSVVTVCSGVALGSGHIVTFCAAPNSHRFRITLPDGEQADAELQVADDYSGLKLLKISRDKLVGLPLAEKKPVVGEKIMTAAAAGIERPSVSLGIVSAAERAVGRAGLPPLLQCDVRTTDTSSGAAVINGRGELLGIIAATDSPDERRGWTYAIPVSHVARLLQAHVEGRLVELKRRRPVVGWTLAPGQARDVVVVEAVAQGGAAEKAGIKQGDQLLQTSGRKIRNPYQAVNSILNKQPGDEIRCLMFSNGQQREVVLTLGGTVIEEGKSGTRGRPLYSLNTVYRINDRNQLERATRSSSELAGLFRQVQAFDLLIRQQQVELDRHKEGQRLAEQKIQRLEEQGSGIRDAKPGNLK